MSFSSDGFVIRKHLICTQQKKICYCLQGDAFSKSIGIYIYIYIHRLYPFLFLYSFIILSVHVPISFFTISASTSLSSTSQANSQPTKVASRFDPVHHELFELCEIVLSCVTSVARHEHYVVRMQQVSYLILHLKSPSALSIEENGQR